MKTISLGMVSLAALLLTAITPLWAGTTRTVSVSCVVQPRISAQIEPNLSPQEGSKLIQHKETKKKDLPQQGYQNVIIYSYCAR